MKKKKIVRQHLKTGKFTLSPSSRFGEAKLCKHYNSGDVGRNWPSKDILERKESLEGGNSATFDDPRVIFEQVDVALNEVVGNDLCLDQPSRPYKSIHLHSPSF